MTIPAQGIGPVLAALESEQVGWTRNALCRLEERGFSGRIITADSQDGDFYLGDALAFAPAQNAAPLVGAAGEDLVACLDMHDDTMRQIEDAIGLAAEFHDYGPLAEAAAVIALARDGAAIGRVAIRKRVIVIHRKESLAILSLGFIAARLPIADAERLSPGDMLILERGPWSVIDCPSDLSVKPLGLHPETGVIALVLAPSQSAASTPPEPINMTQPNDVAGLKVAVALHLADIALTTDELSALSERGTLDIGAVNEGLSATLSVGGRTIGRGEIVRLGDRFAVLLDGSESPRSSRTEDENSDDASEPMHEPGAARSENE